MRSVLVTGGLEHSDQVSVVHVPAHEAGIPQSIKETAIRGAFSRDELAKDRRCDRHL